MRRCLNGLFRHTKSIAVFLQIVWVRVLFSAPVLRHSDDVERMLGRFFGPSSYAKGSGKKILEVGGALCGFFCFCFFNILFFLHWQEESQTRRRSESMQSTVGPLHGAPASPKRQTSSDDAVR